LFRTAIESGDASVHFAVKLIAKILRPVGAPRWSNAIRRTRAAAICNHAQGRKAKAEHPQRTRLGGHHVVADRVEYVDLRATVIENAGAGILARATFCVLNGLCVLAGRAGKKVGVVVAIGRIVVDLAIGPVGGAAVIGKKRTVGRVGEANIGTIQSKISRTVVTEKIDGRGSVSIW
jgi:hypothetical protein